MPTKDQRFSVSRYKTYCTCPSQFEWHYILKMPKIENPAAERGKHIHKLAENFVNGIVKGLPNELKNFRKEFLKLKKHYQSGEGVTEIDLSINSGLEPSNSEDTDWFIGFSDYVLIISDGKHAIIIDYKTGKKYPNHVDQAHAYAMALFCIFEFIEDITVEFWYLDDANPDTNVNTWEYKRGDLQQMVSTWDKRINKMYADKVYKATPNKYCNWCARNVKNGGDCKK